MRTIKQILEAFKKDLRIGYQAQKNVVDISEHYIHELSEADLKGGGVDYSLEEQDTGLKWIDGKDIYQKSYKFLAPFVSGNNTLTLNIPNAVIRSWEVYVLDNVSDPTTIGQGDEIKVINANGSRIIVWIASGTFPYLSNGEIDVTVRYTK